MSKEPPRNAATGASRLGRVVGAKAARKLGARNNTTVWPDLSVMGLIGWSIVLPTLLGAALGRWLDGRFPLRLSWTLTMIILGLALGCWNAWYWVVKAGREQDMPEENDDA